MLVFGPLAGLETQVLEITAGSRVLPKFHNDGLEAGQGADSRHWRHVRGPHGATGAGQQESGLNYFKGSAAVKPEAALAGLGTLARNGVSGRSESARRRHKPRGWSSDRGSKRRESFLPPAHRGFLLAFAHPIAVAFNRGDVGVMEQTVERCDDIIDSRISRWQSRQSSGSLRKRDEIVIEKVSDALEAAQLMGERELAIRNLDRDSNMLRQIRRALSRIANGTYGVCLHCEEDMLPKRMAAVPWAAAVSGRGDRCGMDSHLYEIILKPLAAVKANDIGLAGRSSRLMNRRDGPRNRPVPATK
jgi:RNA polymerase-binding transcription factor DksA